MYLDEKNTVPGLDWVGMKERQEMSSTYEEIYGLQDDILNVVYSGDAGSEAAMTWNSEMTAEAARRRLAKHEERIKKLGNLRREARIEAERLAREIGGADPSVRKIWGFGSVFEEGRPFREDSDIDLASDGG